MFPIVSELAHTLDRLWRRFDYDARAMPAVAEEALHSVSLCGELTASRVLSDFAEDRRDGTLKLPHRATHIMTLYSAPRFNIFFHYWGDDLATPHQHSWGGAYQVLEGHSVVSSYAFSEKKRVTEDLSLGDVRTERTYLLRPGDIEQVVAGSACIHSLSYAERPGAAVSIRHNNPVDFERDYLRPCVSYNLLRQNNDLAKRINALFCLQEFSQDGFDETFRRLVRNSDMLTIFQILHRGVNKDWRVSDALFSVLQERFGDDNDLLMSAIDDFELYHQTKALMRDNDDSNVRFLLAALYNATDRDSVLRLTEDYLSGRNVKETLGDWIARLLIDPSENDDRIPEYVIEAFGRIASGERADAICRDIAARFGEAANIDQHLGLIEAAAGEMRNSLVYAPLFESAGAA